MPMDPTAAVAAYAAGSLGYSINAQGFLLFYVLGAVKVLGDLGLIGPEAVTASRGTASLVSAAVCSRTPYDHILAALQQYWGASNDAALSLSSRRALLRQAADQMLAADAHTLCSSRAFIQTRSLAGEGLSQRMLMPHAKWLSYMLLPPSIKTLSYMHYLGRVDAYVWANSTGLVKAAVAEQQQQLTGLLLQDISSLDRVDALFQKFVQWQSRQ
ncbi:hypothetical protein OEZ85_002035 [Tetradesmus obliquus]|uniref:Uncharacterized protein n=1 Tax=Tetradesmus obliquus TaxID=3088 RepID=A0ABY8U293_TETOB|nr:hypothetical protein OEZ85_002035 [Tetradesmus obliquus]